MNELLEPLSKRGNAIQAYKLRANEEGAAAWAEVPCADSITMHIPKFDVEAVGSKEIDTKVFGLLADAGISQSLVGIQEFGNYVTCFLRVSDGTSEWESVEVFLFNEHNKVAEIWAL